MSSVCNHRLTAYLDSGRTWSADNASHALSSRPVAYFSAEFGLHESLRIYSGGLGVLAGDHLKSASDLGLPLVAIGLFYGEGYFEQRLDADGLQHEEYPAVDLERLPLQEVRRPDGQALRVEVETRSGTIAARVLRADVGRVPLYLLDSDVQENSPADRSLTARLYGGDRTTRIRQELLLGVGGGASARRPRNPTGRRAPERGTQRVRRARARFALHGRGGARISARL